MVTPFIFKIMKNKKSFIYVLAIMITSIICIGVTSCGDDDDDNNAIVEYVGTWSCTSPASYWSGTIVTVGTTLQITSSGDMTWTMPNNNKYKATMRALGDDWAEITYNQKTYKAEIYVRGNELTINVNGDANLKVKDFPFDGDYKKVK